MCLDMGIFLDNSLLIHPDKVSFIDVNLKLYLYTIAFLNK